MPCFIIPIVAVVVVVFIILLLFPSFSSSFSPCLPVSLSAAGHTSSFLSAAAAAAIVYPWTRHKDSI